MRQLLEGGAELGALDEGGRSALSWAAGEGHEASVLALLHARAAAEAAGKSEQAGGSLDRLDQGGLAALHHAAKAGSLGCVRGREQNPHPHPHPHPHPSPNPNPKPEPEQVRALLEHGASALQRSGGGELPEEMARRGGETSAATAGALCSVLGAAAEAESLARQKALLAELEGEGAGREGGAAARGARSARKKKAKKKKGRLEVGPHP